MEPLHLEKEDLLRMWSQIVTQIGADRYSYEEWQENYEEFMKCMLPSAEPHIRILNLEHLMQMNVKQSQKVVPVKQINAQQKPPPISHMPVAISMLRIPRVKEEPQIAQDVKDQKEEHADLEIIEQVGIKLERDAQEIVKPDQEPRQTDEDEHQQKSIEQMHYVKHEPRETEEERQEEQQKDVQDQQPEQEEQLQPEPELPQDPANQLQQPEMLNHEEEEKQSTPKQTSSKKLKVQKAKESLPPKHQQRKPHQHQSQNLYRSQNHHHQMRHLVHEQLHAHNLVPKHRNPFHSMQLHHHQHYQQMQHQQKIYHEQFHHAHPAHHYQAHFQHLDWRSKELKKQYPFPQNIMDTQAKPFKRSLHDRHHPYDRHPYLRPSCDQLAVRSRHRSHVIESPVYERHQESSSRLPNGHFYDSRGKAEAGSDDELENKLIAEALHLASMINTTDDIPMKKNYADLTTNSNEAIDRWLQNYDDKAPRAIELKTSDTSDFFNSLPNLSLVVGKTSEELKEALQNAIFWEVNEEDKFADRETKSAQKVIPSAKQKQSESDGNKSKKKKKSSK